MTREYPVTENVGEDKAPVKRVEEGEPFTEWFGVPLQRKVFEGENTIEVFAGTSAPQGGNVEHGAQTVLMLNDLGKTAIQSVRILMQDGDTLPSGFIVILGGDSEAATFADALEFAAKTIRRQLKENHGGES